MSILPPSPPLRTPIINQDGLTSWPWARWFQGLITPQPTAIGISTTYIAQPNDIILADTTTAGFTITLPPASKSQNALIRVMKVSADGHTLTIDGNGADTINGAATATTTTQYAKFNLICGTATGWFEF